MNWLTKWSFKNKAPILLIAILTLILGTISYFQLPKEFLPSADNPVVTVIVVGEGVDAETVHQQVTQPIEKAVSAVKGKTNVFSASSDGFSKVDILLDSDADAKSVSNEVKEALDLLTLPEGFSPPIVSQLNLDMIPLWQLGIVFSNGATGDQMEKVENDVLPRFQGIKGVNNVSVYGKNEVAIVVEPDQKKMDALGLPPQALLSVLQKKPVSAAVAEETIDEKAASIKVVGRIDGIEALKELEVMPKVKLKDVAKITVSDQNDKITRINGKDAVALMIFKESNVNAVSTGERVEEAIQEINEEMEPDLQVMTLVSFSDFIVQSTDSMMQAVLLGALFATVVLLIFLRHIRMTLVTIVSIPLSLGLTLLLLQLSGVTLNLLTLGAVAVAVGRLIDDSIVVVENIYRKVQKGELSKEVLIEATKEVTSAITSSTLTTVAVFLPIGLVKSLQDLLLPFALTITYSLLASLLVALTVVPLMSNRLLKGGKVQSYSEPKRYIRILTWCLNHKWVPLTLSFIVFVGSIGVFFTMPQGTADASDNDINIMLTYPDDLPFEKVKQEAIELESDLREQQGVKDVLLMAGSSVEDAQFGHVKSQNSFEYFVVMKEGADSEALMKELEKKKEKKYSDAQMDIMLISMTASSGSTIQLDIVGKDSKKIAEVSSQVMEKVKEIDGVEKVSSNQEALKPVYSVVVDPKKADAAEITGQMRMLLNPFPIGSVTLDGKETPVVFDSSIRPSSQKDLEKIQVLSGDQPVALSKIAKLEKTEQPTTRLVKDGDEYVRIEIKADPKRLSEVNQKIVTETNTIDLPKGVSLQMGGAATMQAEQFVDLFQVMAVSIALVYLIMVITFKTLRAPLVILFTLPLAVVGAVLGLLIAGQPVDVGAMIGALMLIGIVVTNAIVFLDRVRQNEQTMTIREALLEAGVTRLRPIVMTAVSTIFAMVPLLFGREEMGALVSKGMAVVVIGGLAVATLLTLVVIPVVYELFHFRRAKKQRLAAEKNRAVAG